MLEIKVLGRGGFGVVSSAQIIGRVFLELGFWTTSTPHFGAERRGAPVHADVRISSEKIRIKSFVKKCDITIVLDPSAFKVREILSFSKTIGIIVINGSTIEEFESKRGKTELVFIEGTKLSLKKFDSAFANIIILGSVFKLLGITDLELITKNVKSSLSFIEERQIFRMIEVGSSLTDVQNRIQINIQ